MVTAQTPMDGKIYVSFPRLNRYPGGRPPAESFDWPNRPNLFLKTIFQQSNPLVPAQGLQPREGACFAGLKRRSRADREPQSDPPS